MTTEKAIELLHRISDSQFDGIHGDERREALSMAVRALEQNLVQESGGLVQDLVKDCISRQQAIDAICKACSLSGDYQKCDGYPDESTWCEELVALRALPSAQSQWIPCSDRLPEKSGEYLVTRYASCLKDEVILDIARYEDGKWYKAYPVKAWATLPKPYGGDAK